MRKIRINTEWMSTKLPCYILALVGVYVVIDTTSGERISRWINEKKYVEEINDESNSKEVIINNKDVVIKEDKDETKVIINTTKPVTTTKPTTEIKEENEVGNDVEEVQEVVEEPKELIYDDLYQSGYNFKKIRFDKLLNTNPDTVSYIEFNGLDISLPVVKSKDNEDYLGLDFNRKESNYGTIYQDCRNVGLDKPMYELSDINVLYGHNMYDYSMFTKLVYYDNQNYYDNHDKYFVIYTLDGYAYKSELFAGCIVEAKENSVYRDNFESEEAFKKYIKEVKANSEFKSDVEINYGDKLLVLVTCYGDKRFLLYGKMTKQLIKKSQYENNEVITREEIKTLGKKY